MTGYLTATSGNVYVNDLNINDHTHEIQKQIGYLPELNPLYGEMRVYDLLKFTGNIRNVTGNAFKKALAKFGVSSPDELDDEKKKDLFNYVDKNYKAEKETD